MTLVHSSQDALLGLSEAKNDLSLLGGVPLGLRQLSGGCLALPDPQTK